MGPPALRKRAPASCCEAWERGAGNKGSSPLYSSHTANILLKAAAWPLGRFCPPRDNSDSGKGGGGDNYLGKRLITMPSPSIMTLKKDQQSNC